MDAVTRPGRLEGLAPPPRALPLHLKVDELFGGVLSQCGWIFLLIGSALSWAFVGHSDLGAWRFREPLERVTGRSSGCGRTNFTVNHRRVMSTDFFFHQDGKAILATSYGYRCYEAGQDVPVEFPAGRPELARVSGLRGAEFPASGAFVLIFPALGLFLAGLALRAGLRDLDLLARGLRARGTVTDSRPTNITENNRRLWELDVAFKDAFGHETTFQARTCFPQRFEGPGPHDVLYDPDAPARAIAVDALEEPLSAGGAGALTSDGWGRAVGCAIIPALTLLGNAACVAWLLSR